jgi:hypothetical protein
MRDGEQTPEGSTMARSRHDHLDDRVLELLDGTELAGKVGHTFELVTVDEDGSPHAALLSVGEVLAIDERSLRLALWSTSTTTENLHRDGHGLLTLVTDDAFYAVTILTRPTGTLVVDGKPLACFEATVGVSHRDEVGYAEVTNGITFRLHDPAAVTDRWWRTIDALREPAADDGD